MVFTSISIILSFRTISLSIEHFSKIQRMPPIALSVEKAVDKLIDASKVIQNRIGVKLVEDKYINAALTLLAGLSSKQHEVYLNFLRRVQKVIGLSIVVLYTAGLGLSAIIGMRDYIQVDLPYIIKEREDELKSDVLQGLTDTYSATCMFGSSLI